MTTSCIRSVGGVPTLHVNGKPVPGCAYMTYLVPRAAYGDFAAAGYNLFSLPVFFSSQTIQERGPVPPFTPGIFDEEEPDFSVMDGMIEQILRDCPGAFLFPRVNLSLPLRWEQENPDDLCDTTLTGNRRPCFSSDKWAEETKRFLKTFLDHTENASYRDAICGYQLAGGNTEEWFSFDDKGSVGLRSREKFSEYTAEHGLAGTEEEYYAFLSRIVAERICEFADFTKEYLRRPLVVGTFYGYTFETPNRTSCHHAMKTVLECDSVDFVCSPVSYTNDRAGGLDHPNMLALDSVKLHGKLYFAENDSRTHLTRPPYDIPHFQKPVWMPRDKTLTVENMKLHFARALTHGHAFWWFDMWGGWYRDPLYMDMMRQFRNIAGDAAGLDLRSAAETAVLVDEGAYCHIDDNRGADVCSAVRTALGLMGTPYDVYLASDYEFVRGKYKAWILLEPCRTPLTERIAAELPDCLRITPQNCNISAAELRRFCRERGVHIYCEKDAVVYVSRSHLFLHTASAGESALSLPKGMRLRPILGTPGDMEKAVLPTHTGYLFALESLE